MEISDILDEYEQSSGGNRSSLPPNLQQQLVTALVNERMAPDLLQYKHRLMERVLSEIQHQQQFLLDSYEYGDSNAEAGVISSDFKLQLMIIETDIERLSYLVKLYTRTRLAKIDDFTIYYINETSEEADSPKLMSKLEMEYMHKHFKILTQLYNNSFLKKLPDYLTLLDDTSGGESMIEMPDLDQPVFIHVLSEETIVLQLGGDELVLSKGGIYVVRYRLIKRYIDSGDVVLI